MTQATIIMYVISSPDILSLEEVRAGAALENMFHWMKLACHSYFSFFFFLKEFLYFCYLFIYFFWLCWVFVSVRGLSLVAASGGHSSSRCAGLSLSRPLLLRSTSSRCAGSVVVAHRPSCSAACGIFPDQGSNPCALHWQADSQPLRHQGSPIPTFLMHSHQELTFIQRSTQAPPSLA